MRLERQELVAHASGRGPDVDQVHFFCEVRIDDQLNANAEVDSEVFEPVHQPTSNVDEWNVHVGQHATCRFGDQVTIVDSPGSAEAFLIVRCVGAIVIDAVLIGSRQVHRVELPERYLVINRHDATSRSSQEHSVKTIRPSDVDGNPDTVHQVLLDPVKERTTVDVEDDTSGQVKDGGVNSDFATAPVAAAGARAQDESTSDSPIFETEWPGATDDFTTLPGGDDEAPIVAGERIAQREAGGRTAFLLVSIPEYGTEVTPEGSFGLLEVPGVRVKRVRNRKRGW